MASAKKSHFVYEPLSHDSKQIRLLEILAGEEKDNIRCQIVRVSLDDNPSYVALSYTWDEEDEEILCGDAILPVKKNLFGFLKRYRTAISTPEHSLCQNHRESQADLNQPLRLWVDALCRYFDLNLYTFCD